MSNFLWLAHKQRLFTNERRFRRGISASDACSFCSTTESTSHMIIHCAVPRQIWNAIDSLHIITEECHSLQGFLISDPTNKVRNSVIMALMWNIWKQTPKSSRTMRNLSQLLFLWLPTTFCFGLVDIKRSCKGKSYLIGGLCFRGLTYLCKVNQFMLVYQSALFISMKIILLQTFIKMYRLALPAVVTPQKNDGPRRTTRPQIDEEGGLMAFASNSK